MVLKIYFGLAFLVFIILLGEWAKRKDGAPFWIIPVGAVFWPITLGLFLEHLWTCYLTRKSSR
jgi:hypothetical protein